MMGHIAADDSTVTSSFVLGSQKKFINVSFRIIGCVINSASNTSVSVGIPVNDRASKRFKYKVVPRFWRTDVD